MNLVLEESKKNSKKMEENFLISIQNLRRENESYLMKIDQLTTENRRIYSRIKDSNEKLHTLMSNNHFSGLDELSLYEGLSSSKYESELIISEKLIGNIFRIFEDLKLKEEHNNLEKKSLILKLEQSLDKNEKNCDELNSVNEILEKVTNENLKFKDDFQFYDIKLKKMEEEMMKNNSENNYERQKYSR